MICFEPLRRYFDFSGRSGRWEYWSFQLFQTVTFFALKFIDQLVGTYSKSEYFEVGLLSGPFVLAVSIPVLSVSVRRLHDTDRRGWWILIVLVPIIGFFWLIILHCLKGTRGDNRFGPEARKGSSRNEVV